MTYNKEKFWQRHLHKQCHLELDKIPLPSELRKTRVLKLSTGAKTPHSWGKDSS